MRTRPPPSQAKKALVLAFGFDSLGFLTSSDIAHDLFTIRFIPYRSTEALEGADGLLIPSGIFEKIEQHSREWESYQTCDSDVHRLAEREKQILKAFAAGTWTCFLLRKLDNGTNDRWSETDLAKKMANQMFKGLDAHDPIPHLYSKADEFRNFFETYGIARTTLGSPRFEGKTRRLATNHSGSRIYAAEYEGGFFFLPLKVLHNIAGELPPLLINAVESALAYKQRHEFYLPDWLRHVKFKTEMDLASRITNVESELIQLKEDSRRWERYKGIVCSSGNSLNEIVVTVLRTFFELNLHSKEAYIEDAIIYDEAGEPCFVVEVKGVNGGIRREHIYQVDSHRERLQLPPTVPGLLIINDFADVPNLDERKKKQIDSSHLQLAVKQNVRILETTTLLDIMLRLEDTPERASTFVQACLTGNPLVQPPDPLSVQSELVEN